MRDKLIKSEEYLASIATKPDCKPCMNVDEDAPMTLYVLFTEEAGRRVIEQTNGDKKDPAVDPEEHFRSTLARFMCQLTECLVKDTDKIEIEVAGFASSSKWEEISQAGFQEWRQAKLSPLIRMGLAANEPEAFNLWVARKRAENVIEILNKILEEAHKNANPDCRRQYQRERIQVHLRAHFSYEDMQCRLRFRDFSGSDPQAGYGYSRGRAILTRRAEIRVVQAGSCSCGR